MMRDGLECTLKAIERLERLAVEGDAGRCAATRELDAVLRDIKELPWVTRVELADRAERAAREILRDAEERVRQIGRKARELMASKDRDGAMPLLIVE